MANPRGHRWTWLDQVRNRVRDKTLSPTADHVALVLAVHYINGSDEAWPSQQELATATGLGRRTVQRALEELHQQGLLEVRHGRPAGTFGCVYRLANCATVAQFGGSLRA